MAEGYLICSFADERDFGDDVKLKCDVTVVADNVTTAEVASVMMHEETPLGQARKMLNHIQSEEQQHDEKIYAYMKANGMYS